MGSLPMVSLMVKVRMYDMMERVMLGTLPMASHTVTAVSDCLMEIELQVISSMVNTIMYNRYTRLP